MHKAIRYRRNPHFVFRKGFRTANRPPVILEWHLPLAVRKVYFSHSLKVTRLWPPTPVACRS